MKLGVLGLGFMGSTHLQGIGRIPDAKLVAVMDVNQKRLSGDLSEIQGNLGGPGQKLDFSSAQKYNSIEGILSDPEVEAVDICLPTNWHASATMQALIAGKHVLVEKPMALDGAAADEMLAEAKRQDRVLMVAQVLRFFPEYMALSKLVKSGELGEVRSALFRRRTAVPTWGPWEFDKKQSGGGVFDLLIHDVDQALHLFGIPEAVSSTGHEDMKSGIDAVTSEFHYPSIGSVTITGGWFHVGEYPFSMEYTVIGDRGVVEYSSAGRPATVYWSDGRKEVLAVDGTDAYQAEIAYFLECASAGRQPDLCMPEDSAAAVKVTRLMEEARERKGSKVPCTL